MKFTILDKVADGYLPGTKTARWPFGQEQMLLLSNVQEADCHSPSAQKRKEP